MSENQKNIKVDPTAAAYDSVSKEWAETVNVGEQSSWLTELLHFQEILPKGRVLEIGASTGKEGDVFKKSGYDYIGVDLSAGLLKEAKQLHPDLAVAQTTARELPFADNTFDGFWTAATLIHIPKQEMPKVLAEIFRVLKPDAKGFISMRTGSHEGPITEPMASGELLTRFFAFYTLDEFKTLLESHGFIVLKSKNKDERWMTFFVQANKPQPHVVTPN
jgi:ubiquinone/menaquinone biosynthesis C-methylase UbiE